MSWVLLKRVAGGTLLAVALMGAGWIFLQAYQAKSSTDSEKTRRKGQPIPVRTELVAETDVEVVVGGTGLTYPSQDTPVQLGQSRDLSVYAPFASLNLVNLHVHEGDFVKQGQPICDLTAPNFTEYLKQLEATHKAALTELEHIKKQVSFNRILREMAVTSADANLQYRTQDLETRRKNLDAFDRLKAVNATNDPDYYNARSLYFAAGYNLKLGELGVEQAKVAIPVGEAKDASQLDAALSTVETARVNLEAARYDYKRFKVKSPATGVITFGGPTEPAPGQVIGITSSFVRVLTLDPVHIQMDLPQERLDDVTINQPAEVVLDSFPREVFRGTLIRISPLVNSQLRVVPAVIRLNNPSNRIKSGISGFVRLRSTHKALTVPVTATVQQGTRATVFRVEDGRVRLREVRLGNLIGEGMVEVLSGLNRGDEVVIYQDFYRHSGELIGSRAALEDNDPVDPNWRRWTRRD
jgi:multidrug efflux pump subunit AcrA (membrane-fusion protein)